jgi:hypothetical protein
MDLLYGVNQSVKVIEFGADFIGAMQHYTAESNMLLDEMKETERFKAAVEKYELKDAVRRSTKP